MLLRLAIKNFAIIDQIELSFDDKLTVITGETGAGKSIILGALELILGKRANHASILNKEKKCVIEASFSSQKASMANELLTKNDIEVYDDIIIRREINTNGRGRSFLNDTPVNLELLKQVGNLLIDMHRQFDSHELLLPNEQLFILDHFLELQQERALHNKIFSDCKKLQCELEEKKAVIKQNKSEQDYLEYVLGEIQELQLQDNDIEKWGTQLELAENTQSIKESLSSASFLLQEHDQSLISSLQNISKEVGRFSNLSDSLSDIEQRLQSSVEELKDITAEIEIQNSQFNTDQEQLQLLNEKIEQANKLLHKHNCQTTDELIKLSHKFNDKLSLIATADIEIDTLSKKWDQAHEKSKALAEKLSKKRIKGIKSFSKKINAILPDLGFTNAKFEIEHSFCDLQSNGIDVISFLIDVNNIGKLSELKSSISGGEMSRIMLAIKSLLAENAEMPCLIFDEIDTGISGETANKVGDTLRTLGNKHQVISITHLPQIAAKAQQHLFVYKEAQDEKLQTQVKKLSHNERVSALATMLGGEQAGSAATKTAAQLLKNN